MKNYKKMSNTNPPKTGERDGKPVSYKISAVSYKISAVSYKISTVSYKISAVSYKIYAMLLIVNFSKNLVGDRGIKSTYVSHVVVFGQLEMSFK
jgi:hypothetical protein